MMNHVTLLFPQRPVPALAQDTLAAVPPTLGHIFPSMFQKNYTSCRSDQQGSFHCQPKQRTMHFHTRNLLKILFHPPPKMENLVTPDQNTARGPAGKYILLLLEVAPSFQSVLVSHPLQHTARSGMLLRV